MGIITVIHTTIKLASGENITILTFLRKSRNKFSKKQKELMLQVHTIWSMLKEKSYFPLKYKAPS